VSWMSSIFWVAGRHSFSPIPWVTRCATGYSNRHACMRARNWMQRPSGKPPLGGTCGICVTCSRRLRSDGVKAAAKHAFCACPGRRFNVRSKHLPRRLVGPWYSGFVHCTVWFGFRCFFVDPHSQDEFFNRGQLYGFADDVTRSPVSASALRLQIGEVRPQRIADEGPRRRHD
jgi:hypothetical protein